MKPRQRDSWKAFLGNLRKIWKTEAKKKEIKQKLVRAMLRHGYDEEIIAWCVPDFTLEEVESISEHALTKYFA